MRNLLIVLSVLFFSASTAQADVSVSIGISVPGGSIGINMPTYPRLVRVPGYPVYYDPDVHSNFFFYDGLYWVFHSDDWYVSSWYNGPWQPVARDFVPVSVLRIPVRYYRRPPLYFRGWHADAPPHWDERWGRDWERSRRGWNHSDHHTRERRAPLPSYQRRFTGDSYPRVPEVQRLIESKKYRYQPREPVTRQYYQQQPQQKHRQPRTQHREREGRH